MVINLPQPDDEKKPTGSSCSSGDACSSGEPCGSGMEKVYPTAAVRYGYMNTVGEFKYASREMRFGCGANVIIQTRRGIEFGEMVSLTCDGCDKSVSREQIKSYVAASGSDYYHFSDGKILRLATSDDEAEWDHLRAKTLQKKSFCQQRADEHELAMKVLECEHLFGGERTIFYFMSENRVDFRDLVRGLASEFRTRIEMRQVGARDEARLLADYETCGRECCCKNFLKALKPVSMKMAKMQKATLDPAKVSGRCGRLKCCLRYEHVTYEELDKKLPGMGKRVQTTQGAGKIIGRQILTQLLLIATDDGGRLTLPVEETWPLGQPTPPELVKQSPVSDTTTRSPQEKRGGRRDRKTESRSDRGGAKARERTRRPVAEKPKPAEPSGEVTSDAVLDSPAPDQATPQESRPSSPEGSSPTVKADGVDGKKPDPGRRRRRRGRRGRSRNRGDGNSSDVNRPAGNPPGGDGRSGGD